MIIYRCRRCKKVLYIYRYSQDYIGALTPSELKHMLGVCPHCHRELSTNVDLCDVEIETACLKPGRYYVVIASYHGTNQPLCDHILILNGSERRTLRRKAKIIVLEVSRKTPCAYVINMLRGKKIEEIPEKITI